MNIDKIIDFYCSIEFFDLEDYDFDSKKDFKSYVIENEHYIHFNLKDLEGDIVDENVESVDMPLYLLNKKDLEMFVQFMNDTGYEISLSGSRDEDGEGIIWTTLSEKRV